VLPFKANYVKLVEARPITFCDKNVVQKCSFLTISHLWIYSQRIQRINTLKAPPSEVIICLLFTNRKFYTQGRINHCAGYTMGGGPCRQGTPDQLTAKFLPRCFDVSLNVTTTKKEGRQLFGDERCTPREKVHAHQRKTWLRV